MLVWRGVCVLSFFFSSRRRHTRSLCDWSSDVCSSDLTEHFQRYHRVLNRAVWSGRAVSHVLLGVLVRTFVPSGPLVIGVDETLERRWGKKIAAKGVYRDPVRSTQERFVKASGLRWVCLMLVVPVP